MDLFLIPNDVENGIFVSSSGTPCYEISTFKDKTLKGRVSISQIQRVSDPMETGEYEDEDNDEECFVVAEVDWKTWTSPTVIRCPALGGMARCRDVGMGMRATDFLYKRGYFSSSRYFRDGKETYCWKNVEALGFVLFNTGTKIEIARYTYAAVTEGIFAGLKKLRLTIQPSSSLDADLIVLSFMIMERKRREKGGDGTRLTAYDEDPQGDGCAEGGE